MKKYLHSCIVSVIFLYFSKDADSTVSIIKNKQTKKRNCRFTQECICIEVGTGLRARLQQMQKSNLNLGIPSLFAGYESRKKFCQDSGSRKRHGIIQGASHSLFRKRKYMPGYHLFFIKLDYDSCITWIPCFGWKRKKLRNKKENNKQEREQKKWRHQYFGQHFCNPGEPKQRRDSGALGKWTYFLFATNK